MDDTKNEKIRNYPREEIIRHVCCIFLAIETVILARILFKYFGAPYHISVSEFNNVLKFHGIEFSEVVNYLSGRIVVFGVAILFTILSMRYRVAYIFYEIVHMLLGPLVALLLGCEYNLLFSCVIVLIWIYLRFVIYKILSGKRRKKKRDLINEDWLK